MWFGNIIYTQGESATSVASCLVQSPRHPRTPTGEGGGGGGGRRAEGGQPGGWVAISGAQESQGAYGGMWRRIVIQPGHMQWQGFMQGGGGGGGGGREGGGDFPPPFENSPPPPPPPFESAQVLVLKHNQQQSDKCCSKMVCICSKTPIIFSKGVF